MYKTFFSIITLSIFTFFKVYGQQMNYHQKINNAENLIAEGKIQNALDVYSDALGNNIVFAQDLYNATLCAVKLKDYDKALTYSEGLIKRGCTLKFFSTKRFETLRKYHKWGGFVKKYAILKKALDNNSGRNIVIAEIKRLIDIDQSNFCLLPLANNSGNKVFLDSLKQNSDYVSKKLVELFTKYGFLDEKIVGANIIGDTTIAILPIYSVLIRHHYQNKKYDLTPYLKKEFENGKIKPEVFTNWYDIELGGLIGSMPAILFDCHLYFDTFNELRESVELNRKKYFLCSLESIKKKILIKKCTLNCDFLFFTPVNIMQKIDEGTKMSLRYMYEKNESKVLNCTQQ